MHSVRFIGSGRAGCSLASALAATGWDVVGLLGRGDPLEGAAEGVDVVVVATPDDAVAGVARAVRPSDGCVVVHLSGSLGLEALEPHRRRASLHPLVSLPDPVTGARRLAGGVPFAVAGDPVARAMAASLGGIPVEVAEADRDRYHAAACIAANHLVGLMGQVERVASAAGLPLGMFLPLARAALDDVARVGPSRALTGPASRGDRATVERHLAALAPDERPAYRAGVALALRLAAPGGAASPTAAAAASAAPIPGIASPPAKVA
ncbi:MAG: Rossmann-like and DUF2520 domain-containing protein [Acidimicrobiales bacterium]